MRPLTVAPMMVDSPPPPRGSRMMSPVTSPPMLVEEMVLTKIEPTSPVVRRPLTITVAVLAPMSMRSTD